MNTTPAPFVGICVSQEHLDVRVGTVGPCWLAHNEEATIHATADRLQEIQPALVLIESSGNAAWHLLGELYAHKIPVALLGPSRVLELRMSMRLGAKPDRFNGHWLARLAEVVRVPPIRLPQETLQLLIAYGARRRRLAESLTAERKQQAEHAFESAFAVSAGDQSTRAENRPTIASDPGMPGEDASPRPRRSTRTPDSGRRGSTIILFME